MTIPKPGALAAKDDGTRTKTDTTGQEELGGVVLRTESQEESWHVHTTLMLMVIALLLWLIVYTAAVTLSTCIQGFKSISSTKSSAYFTFAIMQWSNNDTLDDQLSDLNVLVG